MEIRKIMKEDSKEIIPLLDQVAKLHIEKRPDIFKAKTIDDIKTYANELINDKDRIVLVATENKIILGIIVLKIKKINSHINLKDNRILWIDELCVNEENRHNGIGKALIKEAKQIAKNLNCKRLELNCWGFNNDAMKFYEKQKFKSQRIIMEIEI